METFVGKYVRTKTHNQIGRVKAKHINFAHTNENIDWFNSQRPRLNTEVLNTPWYSILCNGGGSILVCEEQIIESQNTPINDDFTNPWEQFYFGK